MCLGELARVVSAPTDAQAEVDCAGRRLTVSLMTLDAPVAAGDWLLVHSGFALERLTDEEVADAARIRGEEEELA